MLIIVPHQDDELNLIGTIFEDLIHGKYELFIVFVTNGDFYPDKTKQRMSEAHRVSELLGATTYYLGYGDKYDVKHIYETKGTNDVVASKAGLRQTYGIAPAVDFSMLYTGKHNQYNYSFLKGDIKSCIRMVLPDIIICNDFDNHPDHRMVSIVCDEVIGELVKELNGYRPVVLKKYAYAGVWEGKKDYFIRPMRKLELEDTTLSDGETIILYDDFQRMNIKVNELYYPLMYWKSPLYKLLNIYKSQLALTRFSQVINTDEAFYYRSTKNLALYAEISASSGNYAYVNDFKIIDTNEIKEQKSIGSYVKECTWIPDRRDNKKSLVFKFSEKKCIKRMVLYQSFDVNSCVKEVNISSSGYEESFKLSRKAIECIDFFEPLITQQLQIRISDYSGERAGFREVELFDSIEEFDFGTLKQGKNDILENGRIVNHIVYSLLYKYEMYFKFVALRKISKRIPVGVKELFKDIDRTKSLVRIIFLPVLARGSRALGLTRRVIVTLTSYPNRFETLHLTIKSLMMQTVRADKVILYLGDDSKGVRLPKKVLALVGNDFEIRYVPGNIGSFKKFYYAFSEYPNDIIITVDDDLIYEKTMIELLLKSYERYPDAISAKRVHRMRKSVNNVILGYNDWDYECQEELKPSHSLLATTGAGTLFPPGVFFNEKVDTNVLLTVCKNTDDIWIKFLAIKNDIKVVWVPGKWVMPKETVIDREDSLKFMNSLNGLNDISIRNLEQYFGISLSDYAVWHT